MKQSFALDDALAEQLQTLRRSAAFTHADLAELEDHLRLAVGDYRAAGRSDEEAFRAALDLLGDPVMLIAAYRRINRRLLWAERIQTGLFGFAANIVLWLAAVYAFQLTAIGAYSLGLRGALLNRALQIDVILLLTAFAAWNSCLMLRSRRAWGLAWALIDRHAGLIRFTPLLVFAAFAVMATSLWMIGPIYNHRLTTVIAQSGFSVLFRGLVFGFYGLLGVAALGQSIRLIRRSDAAKRLLAGRALAFFTGGLLIIVLAREIMLLPFFSILALALFVLPYWLVRTARRGLLLAGD